MIAGAAVADITPPVGLALCGFAARTQPSAGVHDRLTARALVIGETALATVDVIGIDAALSARVRARAPLPAANIVIAATHTHGAPVAMPGRLAMPADPAFMQRLEDGLVTALTEATARRRPARLAFGWGADPDVARNRRHAGGITDPTLPVLVVRAAEGSDVMAVLTSYACHPVVLGADNLLVTGDYPDVVRRRLEAAHPGAIALFATGCCGDANLGHSAQASLHAGPDPRRTFAMAETYGRRIAEAALAAPLSAVAGGTDAANRQLRLAQSRRETEPPEVLAARWQRELSAASPSRAAQLRPWIAWAETIARQPPAALDARVTVLDWGGVRIAALPGEIFAATALAIRAAAGPTPLFVIGFADDTPGYIAPSGEFAFGGYEIDEAHRFYGQPAGFAAGCAEDLAAAAIALLTSAALDPQPVA